jgi:hypothetical protein
VSKACRFTTLLCKIPGACSIIRTVKRPHQPVDLTATVPVGHFDTRRKRTTAVAVRQRLRSHKSMHLLTIVRGHCGLPRLSKRVGSLPSALAASRKIAKRAASLGHRPISQWLLTQKNLSNERSFHKIESNQSFTGFTLIDCFDSIRSMPIFSALTIGRCARCG